MFYHSVFIQHTSIVNISIILPLPCIKNCKLRVDKFLQSDQCSQGVYTLTGENNSKNLISDPTPWNQNPLIHTDPDANIHCVPQIFDTSDGQIF